VIDGRISVLELRSVRGTGGGPEKTILFGAERADRARFAITVCYIRDDRDDVFGIDRRAATLDIDYVEVRERHSFDRRIWRTLKGILRDRSIDIVHSHDYKTNLLAWLLAKRTGVIPLSTSHGYTGHSTREKILYYPADKRILARFPRVIAVSTDLKNELVRCGSNPARVDVILNSIDPAAFVREPGRADAIRADLGYARGDVVIGAVGRAEPQKRFDLLIEAFSALAPAKPALRLAIVGDGSVRDALESQIAGLGLANRCRLLGHRTDIAAVHHAFDLFVQSSEYEGTPNAVLEAMAMETPLVATDVGGTSELARHGVEGLIVPPHDVPALCRAIEQILDDPEGARARVRAAHARVESDLSFETRTRRLESIYDTLARERGVGERAGAVPSRVPHA